MKHTRKEKTWDGAWCFIKKVEKEIRGTSVLWGNGSRSTSSWTLSTYKVSNINIKLNYIYKN